MTRLLTTAYPLPSYSGLMNPVITALLRLGIPMPMPMVLLTVPGRRTGRPHTTPVGLFQDDGRRFLFSTFGESNWAKNLRASGTAVITHGRRRTAITAVELTPEQSGPIFQRMLAPYLASPIFGQALRPRFPVTPHAPLSAFIAEAQRHPLFDITDSELTAVAPPVPPSPS